MILPIALRGEDVTQSECHGLIHSFFCHPVNTRGHQVLSGSRALWSGVMGQLPPVFLRCPLPSPGFALAQLIALTPENLSGGIGALWIYCYPGSPSASRDSSISTTWDLLEMQTVDPIPGLGYLTV